MKTDRIKLALAITRANSMAAAPKAIIFFTPVDQEMPMRFLIVFLLSCWSYIGYSFADEGVPRPSINSTTELTGADGKRTGVLLRLTLSVPANLPWNTADAFQKYGFIRGANTTLDVPKPGEEWLNEPVFVEIGGRLYRSSKKFNPRGDGGIPLGPYLSFDVTVALPDLPESQKELAIYKFSDSAKTLVDLNGAQAMSHAIVPPATERAILSPKALWMNFENQPDESEIVNLELNWEEKDRKNPSIEDTVLMPDSVAVVRIGDITSLSVKVSKMPVGNGFRTVLLVRFPKKINLEDRIFIKLRDFEPLVAIERAAKIDPVH